MLFGTTGQIDPNQNFDAQTEALILEGALMDLGQEELQAMLEDTSDLAVAVDEDIVLEKTIVRLDKQAKLSKARKMAIFAVAKERNDPKFKKLLTVWKWERFLEAYLEKKYGNEATRRAKKAMSNKTKSQSKMVQTASAKAAQVLSMQQAKHNTTQPKVKTNKTIKN